MIALSGVCDSAALASDFKLIIQFNPFDEVIIEAISGAIILLCDIARARAHTANNFFELSALPLPPTQKFQGFIQ